jgi:hypothetical protein
MMPKPMRKNLIFEDILLACQAGHMTTAEKNKALWIMRVSDWKLDNVVGIPTALVAKMRAASSFLNDDCDECEDASAPQTVIDAVKEPGTD